MVVTERPLRGAVRHASYDDWVDLAKHVFQVHVVDAEGEVVLRRKLRRAEVVGFFAKLPPILIGMEACATSHHWARQLARSATWYVLSHLRT